MNKHEHDNKTKFEGFRPLAFGDVWDQMTPKERRFAFYTDLIVAIIGAIIVYFLA